MTVSTLLFYPQNYRELSILLLMLLPEKMLENYYCFFSGFYTYEEISPEYKHTAL